jgi:hypothetical protein
VPGPKDPTAGIICQPSCPRIRAAHEGCGHMPGEGCRTPTRAAGTRATAAGAGRPRPGEGLGERRTGGRRPGLRVRYSAQMRRLGPWRVRGGRRPSSSWPTGKGLRSRDGRDVVHAAGMGSGARGRKVLDRDVARLSPLRHATATSGPRQLAITEPMTDHPLNERPAAAANGPGRRRLRSFAQTSACTHQDGSARTASSAPATSFPPPVESPLDGCGIYLYPVGSYAPAIGIAKVGDGCGSCRTELGAADRRAAEPAHTLPLRNRPTP